MSFLPGHRHQAPGIGTIRRAPEVAVQPNGCEPTVQQTLLQAWSRVEVVFEPPSAFEVLVSSASDDPPAARFVLPVHDAPPTGDVSDAVFVPLPALDPEQPDRAIDASDVKSVILESISNLTSQGKPKGRAGKRLPWWGQYID